MIFHHFDTLLVIKSVSFCVSHVFGWVLPRSATSGTRQLQLCFLWFTWVLHVLPHGSSFFAKPRSKMFLHPSASPVPHCRFPCPDTGNVDFTSVYDRFWGAVFCGFAVSETSRFCFAMFLHWNHFRCSGFLSLGSVSLGYKRILYNKSYHVLPDPGLGNYNSVSCDLHKFYMFYLMVALFLQTPVAKHSYTHLQSVILSA